MVKVVFSIVEQLWAGRIGEASPISARPDPIFVEILSPSRYLAHSWSGVISRMELAVFQPMTFHRCRGVIFIAGIRISLSIHRCLLVAVTVRDLEEVAGMNAGNQVLVGLRHINTVPRFE